MANIGKHRENINGENGGNVAKMAAGESGMAIVIEMA